jgi:hypothetical protein
MRRVADLGRGDADVADHTARGTLLAAIDPCHTGVLLRDLDWDGWRHSLLVLGDCAPGVSARTQ